MCIYFFVTVFPLLILSSCGVRKQKQCAITPHNHSPFECDERLAIRNQLLHKAVPIKQKFTLEGKLSDIPLPLDATPYSRDDRDTIFTYQSLIPVDELASFFMDQMEVYGWHLHFSLCSVESFLYFKKADKQCIISLRIMKYGFSEKAHIVIGVT